MVQRQRREIVDRIHHVVGQHLCGSRCRRLRRHRPGNRSDRCGARPADRRLRRQARRAGRGPSPARTNMRASSSCARASAVMRKLSTPSSRSFLYPCKVRIQYTAAADNANSNHDAPLSLSTYCGFFVTEKQFTADSPMKNDPTYPCRTASTVDRQRQRHASPWVAESRPASRISWASRPTSALHMPSMADRWRCSAGSRRSRCASRPAVPARRRTMPFVMLTRGQQQPA
jgi:hypothetical protein